MLAQANRRNSEAPIPPTATDPHGAAAPSKADAIGQATKNNATTLMALGAGIARRDRQGLQPASAVAAPNAAKPSADASTQTYNALTAAACRHQGATCGASPQVMHAVAVKYFTKQPASASDAVPDEPNHDQGKAVQ